jgi:hypothetical protein
MFIKAERFIQIIKLSIYLPNLYPKKYNLFLYLSLIFITGSVITTSGYHSVLNSIKIIKIRTDEKKNRELCKTDTFSLKLNLQIDLFWENRNE